MNTYEQAASAVGWRIFIDLPSRTEFRNPNCEDNYVTDLKGELAWQALCEFMGIQR